MYIFYFKDKFVYKTNRQMNDQDLYQLIVNHGKITLALCNGKVIANPMEYAKRKGEKK